jgi:hypothetical protein
MVMLWLMELLMAGREPLEREPTRRQLQVALANGGKSQTALAEEYGVSQSAISQFQTRHAQVIAEIRADVNNEFAGLAFAQKANRIAALIDLYEKSMESTPKITNKGTLAIGPDGQVIEEIDGRLAAQTIKQIAEELGQLPTRLNVSGEIGIKTNYSIDGVDPSNLS